VDHKKLRGVRHWEKGKLRVSWVRFYDRLKSEPLADINQHVSEHGILHFDNKEVSENGASRLCEADSIT
jgi:hypothetical protein